MCSGEVGSHLETVSGLAFWRPSALVPSFSSKDIDLCLVDLTGDDKRGFSALNSTPSKDRLRVECTRELFSARHWWRVAF